MNLTLANIDKVWGPLKALERKWLMKTMKLDLSREGKPVWYEEGGHNGRIGFATIVCGPSFEPLKPMGIFRRGQLANRRHAMFEIVPGYYLLFAVRYGPTIYSEAYQVKAVNWPEPGQPCADLEPFAYLPAAAMDAYEAADKKTETPNCREPFYYK